MATARLFLALYLDADVSKKLASALRKNRFDVVSAQEVGKAELDDRAQSEYAINEQRTILTYNSKILCYCLTSIGARAENITALSSQSNCRSANCCGAFSRCWIRWTWSK